MSLKISTDLNLTLGTLEIALNVSAVLLGCLTVQTYTYFQHFTKDALAIRILMFIIWGIELASHITSAKLVYRLTVTDWGNVVALLHERPVELTATFYLCSAITPLVESFYLYRIYKFANGSRASFAVGVGLLVVWTRYAGWLFLSVQVLRMGLLDGKFIDTWSWLMILQLTLGALMDAMIAITIVWFLRKRTFEEVDGPSRLVTRVVRWTIQTGAIASAAFITTLITFVSSKNSFIWLGLLAILSKIFSNCFVASLNGRKRLQQEFTATSKLNEDVSLSTSAVAWQSEASWRGLRDSNTIREESFWRDSIPDAPRSDRELSIIKKQRSLGLGLPVAKGKFNTTFAQAATAVQVGSRGDGDWKDVVMDIRPIARGPAGVYVSRETISEYEEFEDRSMIGNGTVGVAV
ncbi:hypothetical protein K435DRAFT_972984 [Dendrothele bispora CBS 962.96]|uniref:DUF6534 domain-containing protein n=1 Tax=Dendrothele bispora (strain CBS 962.96) TaxID=1314807 RepID=A0A4S8KVT4_DENBC|nr:hypothetical protein K435DRAFT_972984 [Dendrothele bispora CBS 962.96]